MANKESIIKATLELASENGLGAVSMSQIANKVGIQKASLYSHFSSKEEIIDSLYEALRERAKERNHVGATDYGELVKGKTPLEVLEFVVDAYQTMNRDPDMCNFYKFILSERCFNREAARIMVAETERMFLATKQVFYAMQAQHIMEFENVDMAAFSFAMAVHSIMDFLGDKKVAEIEDDEVALENYLEAFCLVYQTEKDNR